uniref:Light-regulated protein n=1 Tax=Oryza punctata TaxID=4537 RepID=A0A0E0JD23_ORYPU
MQTAASSVVGFSAVLPAAVKGRSLQIQPPRRVASPTVRVRAAAAAVAVEAAEVDYSSNISVFPMEACDLVGGEACNVQMYPEAKLSSSAAVAASRAAAEEVDRDYLSYDEPTTVFPEEACDDLGGEFCKAT